MKKWLEREYERMNEKFERDLMQNIPIFNPEMGVFVGVEKIKPTKIIQNGIATIVFWNDGTKTVVKLADDDENDLYNAFCAALAKKIFGSNSAVKKKIEQTYKLSKEEEKAYFEILNRINKYFSSFGRKYD